MFPRELISNASDGLEKIHYDSITDSEKIEAQSDFFIKIVFDKTSSAITAKIPVLVCQKIIILELSPSRAWRQCLQVATFP